MRALPRHCTHGIIPCQAGFLLGSRIQALPRRHRSEAVIAAATVLLVVSAAIALLVVGGQTFASGFDSGVLTTGGGLVEAVLLLGALTLAAVTGRMPTSPGVQPSIDQAPL